MPPAVARRTWWQRPRTVVVLGGAALSGAMVAIVLWVVFDDGRSARQQAEQQSSGLALTLEREIGGMIGTLDLSLRNCIAAAAMPGLPALDPAIRQAALFDGSILAGEFASPFVADASGRVIYDSIGLQPRPWGVANRGYFSAHRDNPGLDVLVGPPVRGRRSGAQIVPVTRRINAPDGSFVGVAVGGIHVSGLLEMFRALAIGEQDTVAVSLLDGTLLARRPPDDAAIGRKFVDQPVLAALRGAPQGHFQAVSVIDGTRRFYSYRQVGTLPLVVTVGLSAQGVYAEWSRTAAILGAALLFFLSLGAGLAWALQRELRCRGEVEWLAWQSEMELSAALARLDVLFRNSLDLMFIVRCHLGGRFTFESVNPVWSQVTGVPTAQATGHGPGEFLPERAAGVLLGAWSACVRGGHAVRYSHTLPTPLGPTDLEVCVAPVHDRLGRVSRLVGIGRNQTESNQIAARLLQAQRMEAVSQLTTGMAHDFNSLLQGILVALELLAAQAGIGGEARAAIGVAEKAAAHGAGLVQQLLAFSRKQALNPARVDLTDVLPEFAAGLRRTFGPRFDVTAAVQRDAAPVFADPAQLDNCLLNLALNARDAMPAGGALHLDAVHAGAAAAQEAGLPAGEYACIRLVDTGAGMTQDILARAFDPFFTTKSASAGAGLGLAVVQGFARQSGGNVRIRSQPGQGTTVSLWLPRAAPAAAAPPPPEPPATPQPGRGRVLLVDDEVSVRKTLEMVLSRAGYSPVTAENGDAALALLQAGEACDLMVTDQSMPGMSGSELIRAVSGLRPTLPMMLMTGFDRANQLDQLDGTVTVLRKPFKREAFLSQIDTALHPA